MGRIYLIVGICVAALCAAAVYFDGPGGAAESMFSGLADSSRPFLGGTITNFIFTPLILVFTDYYWAVGAGFLWPMVVIWILFLFISIGATIVGPAMSDINQL